MANGVQPQLGGRPLGVPHAPLTCPAGSPRCPARVEAPPWSTHARPAAGCLWPASKSGRQSPRTAAWSGSPHTRCAQPLARRRSAAARASEGAGPRDVPCDTAIHARPTQSHVAAHLVQHVHVLKVHGAVERVGLDAADVVGLHAVQSFHQVAQLALWATSAGGRARYVGGGHQGRAQTERCAHPQHRWVARPPLAPAHPTPHGALAPPPRPPTLKRLPTLLNL